jgi:exonuclease SbcD
MYKILHTADWHLGHTLHRFPREEEHNHFLTWLLDQLETLAIDALLVAGDIFDSANPSASALAQYYSFLRDAKKRCPTLDIVITSGNHDSPHRLDAPQPLLEASQITVVGVYEPNRCCVPLCDRSGTPVMECAAVPFLRPSDLDSGLTPEKGVEKAYRDVFDRMGTLPRIAMGHAYMVGGQLSELSERKVLGGNQHPLPVSLFPDSLEYVALGHMHLPQMVGSKDNIRYSGSPIPLSLAERTYPHQVVIVEIGTDTKITPVHIPRTCEIVRVPDKGSVPLEEVVQELQRLPKPKNTPFLEVAVCLERPEPNLRQAIDQALGDKQYRLCKITPYYKGEKSPLADALPEACLKEISPHQVFTERYHQLYDNTPPEELNRCFHELVEATQ